MKDLPLNDISNCQLCPRQCAIPEGSFGYCGARKNVGGTIILPHYAKLAALHLDPIEKKPLARFYSGKMVLSAGFPGCNLDCDFCQNDSLSALRGPLAEKELARDAITMSPEELCRKAASIPNNIGIAFTYNEPLIYYEYILDTARLIKKDYPQMKTVLVSNACINAEPLRDLLPFIDAINFDYKGNAQFYRDVCHAEMVPGTNAADAANAEEVVRRSIGMAVKAGVHVEVTWLAIDGLNTDEAFAKSIIGFLADLGNQNKTDIPLHISRYFPRRRMSIPATKKETLLRLKAIAETRLKYVYLGNV
ncbi:MAG: radical SAM protein [Spirochaetaceae bacterium]|nr:radical SAM protein [Spirochaetaceae bacterium]